MRTLLPFAVTYRRSACLDHARDVFDEHARRSSRAMEILCLRLRPAA